jgi:uncharacterized lipoprotein YmbA
MGKSHFRLGIIIVLGVLSVAQFRCTSSPSSRFYVLGSISTKVPEVSTASEARCLSIGIGPIKMPAYLDQPQIVTRGSESELRMAEFDRWAEPLRQNFTRVLSQNLSTQLCTKTVVVFPWRGAIPIDYHIQIDVDRFDGSLGGDVFLEAWWMVFNGESKGLLLSKKSSFIEAVDGRDYKSLISAQSRVLGHFSREIAEAIKTVSK